MEEQDHTQTTDDDNEEEQLMRTDCLCGSGLEADDCDQCYSTRHVRIDLDGLERKDLVEVSHQLKQNDGNTCFDVWGPRTQIGRLFMLLGGRGGVQFCN